MGRGRAEARSFCGLLGSDSVSRRRDDAVYVRMHRFALHVVSAVSLSFSFKEKKIVKQKETQQEKESAKEKKQQTQLKKLLLDFLKL